MAIFMEVLIDPPIEHGFEISSMALLFGIVLPLPLAGMLSDRWGREKTMAVGAVGLGIIGPFMLNVISSGEEVWAFLAQWTIGIFLVLFGGPMNAWLVGKDWGHRSSAVLLSHGILIIHTAFRYISFDMHREVPSQNSLDVLRIWIRLVPLHSLRLQPVGRDDPGAAIWSESPRLHLSLLRRRVVGRHAAVD